MLVNEVTWGVYLNGILGVRIGNSIGEIDSLFVFLEGYFGMYWGDLGWGQSVNGIRGFKGSELFSNE